MVLIRALPLQGMRFRKITMTATLENTSGEVRLQEMCAVNTRLKPRPREITKGGGMAPLAGMVITC